MTIPDSLVTAARKAAAKAYDDAYWANYHNEHLKPENAVDGVQAAADAALAAAFAALPECEEVIIAMSYATGRRRVDEYTALTALARMAES